MRRQYRDAVIVGVTANWDLLTHETRPIVAQRGVYANVPVLAAPVVALGAVGWIPADLIIDVKRKVPPLDQLYEKFLSGNPPEPDRRR